MPLKTSPSCERVVDATTWSYEQAFARNLGLISPDEQQVLRRSRVAIAGMGGVGGVHLMTLTRLGIGAFRIADPDHFEVANFNRQYGGLVRHLGQSKVEVMADEARQINPELKVEGHPGEINERNVGEFLNGVDVFVDGVDFFSIDARRLLFREARERGIWSITAGPLGFSTAWLVFDPRGMSFDDYFDLRDDMERVDQIAAMAVGLCPAATHMPYLDLRHVDLSSGRGPSTGLACQLASGVTAAEVLKILLHRGDVRPAPHYFQFDAYRHQLRQRKLWWGNRNPLQRLKRAILRKRLLKESVT
jgi:molybdopterin/thiamine biosynthesis adenylyltransferase